MILIHVFLMFTTLYDHNTCVSVIIFIVITMSSFTPVTMTVLVIDFAEPSTLPVRVLLSSVYVCAMVRVIAQWFIYSHVAL